MKRILWAGLSAGLLIAAYSAQNAGAMMASAILLLAAGFIFWFKVCAERAV